MMNSRRPNKQEKTENQDQDIIFTEEKTKVINTMEHPEFAQEIWDAQKGKMKRVARIRSEEMGNRKRIIKYDNLGDVIEITYLQDGKNVD